MVPDNGGTILACIFLHSLYSFGEPLLSYKDDVCPWTNSSKYFQDGTFQSMCTERIDRSIREIIIPIGTIFNSEDTQMRSAFRFQIDQFHEKHDLPNRLYTLNQSINITDVANNFKLASSLCNQMSTGVFLFFGTRTVESRDLVEDYTKRFQMPFISPTLSKITSSSLEEGSYQINMKPPLTDAIINMIIYFQWDVVHYLYDSNEGLMRIQDIFTSMPKDRHVRFTYRKLEDVDHSHEELRTLDRMHTPDKNIILDLSSYHAFKSVMRQIAEVGMNKHEYFYLLATLDFTRLDFRRFIHGGVRLTGFDIIDPLIPEYQDFMRDWVSADRNKYNAAGSELMSGSALAVDGAELIIETINNMLAEQPKRFKKNFRGGLLYNNYTKPGIPCTRQHYSEPLPPPWIQGPEILDAMKKVDFHGITGRVKFTDAGFRDDYTLQVLGVGLDQTPQKIGTWNKRHGFISSEDNIIDLPYYENTTERDVKIITTIISKPMMMRKSEEDIAEKNLTGNDIYEGFVPDFAALLSKRIGFKYKFKMVEDGTYGIENEATGEWNGMVQELITHKADLALADFTITFDRERVIDFTKPFMEIGISIMIKKPEIEKPGVFSFMKPFNFKIWIFIIVAYASVSVGLFIISRFSPYEWTNESGEKEPQLNEEFSILNSFWFSIGALMLQGSDSCPRSLSGRVIGTVWWFFVLIIISSYTANLAAFLTIERMVSPIETADDLAKQTEIKYGCLNSGTTREFFANSPVPVYQTMWNFMMSNPQNMVNKTTDGIERVRKSKGKYAFLLESNVIEYENSVQPCNTFKVGRNLNTKGFGVATPKGSDLRDVLNLHVLELTEDSTLIKLKNKWWSDRSQCSPIGGKESSAGKNPLSLSNVAGVFYILISGLVIAVVYGALSFIVLKVRLIPVTNYAKGLQVPSLAISSDKGNGSLNEYAVNNGHSNSNQDVQTYTYNPPPMIGFEAFQQTQEHSDV